MLGDQSSIGMEASQLLGVWFGVMKAGVYEPPADWRVVARSSWEGLPRMAWPIPTRLLTGFWGFRWDC